MQLNWQAIAGNVRMPLGEAEWWGASLAVLVAVVHHPHVLAAQPDIDPVGVAREVGAQLDELERAAAHAAAQLPLDDADGYRGLVTVRREDREIVFSPGAELDNLVQCLDVFAAAVLDPQGEQAGVARGPIAYAAAAWSRDIGIATGALSR